MLRAWLSLSITKTAMYLQSVHEHCSSGSNVSITGSSAIAWKKAVISSSIILSLSIDRSPSLSRGRLPLDTVTHSIAPSRPYPE
jgi:hypothetical protein